MDGRYRQGYQYDVWDNMTTRTDRFWSGASDTFSASYTNDRNSAWTYNASGDVVTDTMQHQYNAAGYQSSSIGTDFSIDQTYDGDGQPAERVENRPGFSDTMYYLRSSVLGGKVVTELNAQGGRKSSYLFINGEETWRYDGSTANLLFTLRNPVTGMNGFSQLDPLGGYVGFDDPYQQNPNPDYDWLKGPTDFFVGDGNPFDRGSGCTWNQLPIPCGYAALLLAHGAAVLAPLDSVIAVRYRGEWVLARWQAYADGYEGYVPVNASYPGEGHITSINPPKLFSRGSLAGDTDLAKLNGSGDPEVVLARSTGFGPAQSGRGKVTYLETNNPVNPWIESILDGFTKLPKCVEAYAALGIDLQKLLDTGLVIGGSHLFEQKNAQELGLTEYSYNRAKQDGLVGSTSVEAFTVPQRFNDGPAAGRLLVTSGGPHIFLNAGATTGGYNNLKEDLAHELIHAGGYSPQTHWYTGLFGTTDLDHLGGRLTAVERECGKVPTPR